METAYIVSMARTPVGSFGGQLSGVHAAKLGAHAIAAALKRISLDSKLVEEVYMGNVMSANLGQAPARQAAIFAGLPYEVICTSINKVCASSLKTVMLATQSIMLGQQDIIIAGGFENMSATPYYLDKARTGYKLFDGKLIDGLIKDGVWDVYHDCHMAIAAEKVAARLNISREDQDNYCIESYKRAALATQNGWMKAEIEPFLLQDKSGTEKYMIEDEEYQKVIYDKIPKLKPAFSPNGTITAANASKINDGGAALVIMSERKMKELNLKPLARIAGFADAEQEPLEFPTSPSLAIPKATRMAGLSAKDIAVYEIHEAFSCVALSNMKRLEIDHSVTNLHGGAVSLGHPLGATGSRTLCALISVLKRTNKQYGAAGACNGGGGASSIVLENCF
ncbi:MAG: acetyl-CoA C-acyltransferase [Bacteroidia bacterium]|nr:acetyl-CoA C-acyltransferase [Bacteroidia bacterium]